MQHGKSPLARELTLYHHGVANANIGSSLESLGKYQHDAMTVKKGHQAYRFLGNNSAAAAAYELYYGLEDVKPVTKRPSGTSHTPPPRSQKGHSLKMKQSSEILEEVAMRNGLNSVKQVGLKANLLDRAHTNTSAEQELEDYRQLYYQLVRSQERKSSLTGSNPPLNYMSGGRHLTSMATPAKSKYLNGRADASALRDRSNTRSNSHNSAEDHLKRVKAEMKKNRLADETNRAAALNSLIRRQKYDRSVKKEVM